LTEIFILN